MIKPSECAAVFAEKNFQKMELTEEGYIILDFNACLCDTAKELFGDFGSCELLNCSGVGLERWLIKPAPGSRAVATAILVSAWRLHTAAQANPWFDFGNCHYGSSAWGDKRPNNDQVRTLLNLLVLQKKVRLYHDEEEAFRSVYGSPLLQVDGYIAIQIDSAVLVIGPSGLLTITTVKDVPTN